jgi:hypothetical protein
MVLSQAHIRPGLVREIVDENGVVKVSCCGLFSDQDDPELLPPVYQFPLGGANNFSSPKVDDEIWVLFFDDNPMELFYIRKDKFPEHLQKILGSDYKECEVLASRELSSGMIQIYFTDGEGWIIRNVDSVINMRADGSILLDTGSAHRKIDICDNSISLGSEGGSAHTAAYGDKVVKSLKMLNTILNTVAMAGKLTPFTIGMSTAIDALRPMFEQSIEEIESQHVTLD